jgi:hypothetical protein
MAGVDPLIVPERGSDTSKRLPERKCFLINR